MGVYKRRKRKTNYRNGAKSIPNLTKTVNHSSGSSTNAKQNKHKESHTKAHRNQIIENQYQRGNLKSRRGEEKSFLLSSEEQR